MKPELQFDFIVNKETKTLTIKREFDAKRQRVWDCHTKSELLDQWFAPKPLTTKTKAMDFIEGGHWHCVMIDAQFDFLSNTRSAANRSRYGYAGRLDFNAGSA